MNEAGRRPWARSLGAILEDGQDPAEEGRKQEEDEDSVDLPREDLE